MLKKFSLATFSIFTCSLALELRAYGCDLCAIYTAQQLHDQKDDRWSIGAGQQFASFRTLQDDGSKIENTNHEFLSSSINQLFLRYDYNQYLGTQLTVPIIARRFRRIEGEEVRRGSLSGVGDMSVLFLSTPLSFNNSNQEMRWNFRAGIELPTGDTDELEEQRDEHEETDADHRDDQKHGAEEGDEVSGIHGHDLALGSGSFDYLFGTNIFLAQDKLVAVADVQYIIRTEGDFDYRYNNDLLWQLSAGGYVMLDDTHTILARMNLLGEYKDTDVVNGDREPDTGLFTLFTGPEVVFTVYDHLLGQLSFELPLLRENTGVQIVSDYRIRLGLIYRF